MTLESALITHLQDFLLELGNGFSFVARQKRIHIGGDEFFVDLVLYDRFEKQDFENPTVGVLLCADKNDVVVKITLPEDNKSIVASKYQLYLPTEQQLLAELKSELDKLKEDSSLKEDSNLEESANR